MADESTKCCEMRKARGDFDKYLFGHGIDIGSGSGPYADFVLKVPNGDVTAWDMPQGDAQKLDGVPDRTFDFVYSSHCLEHLYSIEESLQNWVRVLKPGGSLYVVVPDYILYEHLRWPSVYNPDHKHSFSMTLSRSKVGRDNHYHIGAQIAPLLQSLGVSIERVELEDDRFDYSAGPVDQTLGIALAQICVIGRRLLDA